MSKPNLLFLYTDEQRFDTLAAYGNRRIEMPNLNRLAEQSTVFADAYCPQPVCTPSRSTMLTGLYPHANGCVENNIPLRAETPCLPELLDDPDYHCAHHGKWHLGDEIYAQHGFAEWVATEDSYHRFYSEHRDQTDRSPYHHYLVERGYAPRPNPDTPPDVQNRFFRPQIARLPEADSRPAFLGREGSRFVRENAGRPWVLYVNFLEPHMPFYGCRDEQYDPAGVDVPENFRHDIEADPRVPLRARLRAANWRVNGFEIDRELRTEDQWRGLISRYWGLCSLVDTHVATILRALEETGQDDNTIVVFSSDHGDQMSSHRMLGKGVMYEESARVPLLVRLPGQREGRRVTGPVCHDDLVPTLLDVMGAGVPSGLHGVSRRDALEGKRDRIDDDVFIEWHGENKAGVKSVPEYAEHLGPREDLDASQKSSMRAVVTPDGWKFSHSTAGEHELYDLNADPGEENNLAAEAEHADRIADLRDRIRRWQDVTGDELELTQRATPP